MIEESRRRSFGSFTLNAFENPFRRSCCHMLASLLRYISSISSKCIQSLSISGNINESRHLKAFLGEAHTIKRYSLGNTVEWDIISHANLHFLSLISSFAAFLCVDVHGDGS